MERMENPLRRKPGKNVVSLCGDKSVEKAYSFFYVFLNALVI